MVERMGERARAVKARQGTKPAQSTPASGSGTSAPGTRGPHILVVDDEPPMRAVLRQGLEEAGYTVTEAGSEKAAIRLLDREQVDLVTLDLGLPDSDGLDVARQIRARRNVPIIMITGRDTPHDRLLGLEHGADDYIVKPFLVREAVLRVRAVLARYAPIADAAQPQPAQERYAFEAGTLDVVRRELKDQVDALIPLTDAEMNLLTVLLRHAGRVLSRSELSQLLSAREWSPLDRALDVHVARLRKKIEPVSDAPRLIKSVRGVGYVFTGDVRPL